MKKSSTHRVKFGKIKCEGIKNQKLIKIHFSQIRGAFIIYFFCNCHRNSHAMREIPMKSNIPIFSSFYLSIDTSIVPIGALVFVLRALEMRSFI